MQKYFIKGKFNRKILAIMLVVAVDIGVGPGRKVEEACGLRLDIWVSQENREPILPVGRRLR